MRRVLRSIALCLILGVATTCIIAWLCGLFCFGWGLVGRGTFWGVMPGGSPQVVSRGSVSGSRILGFGAGQTQVRNGLSFPQPGDEIVVIGFLGETSVRDQTLIAAALQAGAREWISTEAGWPWRALACEFSDLNGQRGGWTFVSKAGAAVPASGGPVRVLAWKPLWPGFALNVLVFSAGWAVILFAPRTSRRTRRRLRGQCERCGYDLRASPDGRCPECGFTRGR